MWFKDEQILHDVMLERQAALRREAEIERLTAHLRSPWLAEMMNQIGTLLVSFGEKLQRRHSRIMAEAHGELHNEIMARRA